MIILILEETVTQWSLSSHLSFQIDCLLLECVQVTLALGNYVPIAQKRAAKKAAGQGRTDKVWYPAERQILQAKLEPSVHK